MIQGRGIILDGQPKGTKIGDPTGEIAAKISNLHDRIRAVEAARETIPAEYIKGVWQNIVYAAPYPHDAARNTYGRYKSKFVYEVAKRLAFL